MFGRTQKELEVIYSTKISEETKLKINLKFADQYGITLDNLDLDRFVSFSEEEINEIHKLAEGRFNNNRKFNTKQVNTGCGEASCYLERDYPGLIGEKAYEKYLSKKGLNNLTDVNSIECSSKFKKTDKGDFIVELEDKEIKIEAKCNMFDPFHRKQNSLNVQFDQIEPLKTDKSLRPDFWVQIIMVSPTLAYVSGYCDYWTVLNNLRTPDHGAYYAVPYFKIKYFSLNNIPDLD